MDKFIDVLVNISPALYFVMIYISFRFDNRIADIFFWGIAIYTVVFPIMVVWGYGNTYWVVIVQVVLILIGLFSSCAFLSAKVDSSGLKALVFNIIYTILPIYCICTRLKGEYVQVMYCINEAFNNLRDVDYSGILFLIINNKWFEGLSIGIASTVFGGLILSKVQQKKY